MLKDRLLLSVEGDPSPGGGDPSPAPTPAPAPAPTPAPPASAWYAPAETLKTSDPEVWGKFEKSVQSGGHKDLASVIKHVVGLEGKLGSAFTLPGKDAKPEEITAAKTKLQAAGLIPTPPESPDKYEFPIDAIPEAMRDQKTIDTVRSWAHKHGLSAEAVKELAAIELERYNGVVEPALKYSNEQGQKAINDLAAELGKEPDQLLAHSGNWLRTKFSEEDMKFIDDHKLGNHPVMVKFAALAALATGEDISTLPTGAGSGDAEFEEALKFASDPTHPDYKLWFHGDQQDPKRIALQERYENALKKKYGTGAV